MGRGRQVVPMIPQSGKRFPPEVDVRRRMLEQRRDQLRAQAYDAEIELELIQAQPERDGKIQQQVGDRVVTVEESDYIASLEAKRDNGYAAARRAQQLIDQLPRPKPKKEDESAAANGSSLPSTAGPWPASCRPTLRSEPTWRPLFVKCRTGRRRRGRLSAPALPSVACERKGVASSEPAHPRRESAMARKRSRKHKGAGFVLDCSVTMAWYFKDEAGPYARSVRRALARGEAVVPGL